MRKKKRKRKFIHNEIRPIVEKLSTKKQNDERGITTIRFQPRARFNSSRRARSFSSSNEKFSDKKRKCSKAHGFSRHINQD